MSEALLSQIYADPTDQAARMVYEDWLEERGDPRARAIALMTSQSQGKHLGREEQAELDDIIEQHWRAWVGPAVALIPPKSRTRFVDGFLSEVELRIDSDADRQLAADPVFATLRWLTCEHADIVVRPTMKLLRTLSGSLRTFAEVAELPYELDVRTVFVDAKDFTRDLEARVIAARAPVFRNLRSVFATVRKSDAFDWIARSWIPARVESINLQRAPIPIRTFMDLFRANRRLKFILASLPGSAGISFTRWSQPALPALEVRLDNEWDETFAALDDIDGTGWGLSIKYPSASASGDETEGRRTAMQERYRSFARVDIIEPFESPYEGGL